MVGNREDQGFGDAKSRLEEIADLVGDENMPLDEALDLFEEAVSIGLDISNLLEDGLLEELQGDAAPQAGDQAAASEPQAGEATAAGETDAGQQANAPARLESNGAQDSSAKSDE